MEPEVRLQTDYTDSTVGSHTGGKFVSFSGLDSSIGRIKAGTRNK
jgi:hypothetical protein